MKKCPICLKKIKLNSKDVIVQHRNNDGNICIGSGWTLDDSDYQKAKKEGRVSYN